MLLKNDGTLPLAKRPQRVLVTGPQSDSPTNQLGGWTVGWQGAFNLPPTRHDPADDHAARGLEAARRRAVITW